MDEPRPLYRMSDRNFVTSWALYEWKLASAIPLIGGETSRQRSQKTPTGNLGLVPERVFVEFTTAVPSLDTICPPGIDAPLSDIGLGFRSLVTWLPGESELNKTTKNKAGPNRICYLDCEDNDFGSIPGGRNS